MIKEKDIYVMINDINTKSLIYSDVNNDLTFEMVKNYFINSFNEANISVVITNDEIQHSTGFMKNSTCPCLVISSTQRGEELYKYIVTVMKNYETNITVIICNWGGNSKSKELSEKINKSVNKYNKGIDRQDKKFHRNERFENVFGMIGNIISSFIINTFRDIKIKKLISERDKAKIGELEYYQTVSNTVDNTLDKLSEHYDLIEQKYNN